jgi:hypothetical protein
LGIRRCRIALSRAEPPGRDFEVDGIRREGVAQAKLRRSIEQLIWHSEETARGSEEVILPTQEIVRLTRQDVDDGILKLHIRVPNTECRIVKIRGFSRGTGARWLPRRSPAAIDAWLIAKQVKLEHAR